jgi:hypothetical protein
VGRREDEDWLLKGVFFLLLLDGAVVWVGWNEV